MENLPINILNLLNKLNNEDFVKELKKDSKIYLVGGFVRDSFRNEDPKDIDLVIEGISLSRIKKLLVKYGKSDIVGESFSVFKFRPAGWDETIDIALPRIDRKIGEGHKGFEVISNEKISIGEDLKRRDLTINSFCINISTGEIIDPFNGLIDLKRKVLRATDISAFSEDPLRILRTIGFAARFGYSIDLTTMELMRENSHLIKNIAGERIMEELMKIIKKEGNTQIALNLLHETDIDKALFDKKMLSYSEGFEYLDTASFFYVLGLLGDVNPGDFIRVRLKGEARLEKDVRNLDKMFLNLSKIREEEDLKFMLSKIFSESPSLMDAIIIPDEVDSIVLQMRLRKIPKSLRDVMVDGNDVMTISQNRIQGRKVGEILDRVLRDALMNRFNWMDRRASMEHLAQIIYEN